MRDPNDPQKPLYADTIAGNTVRIANEIADWATQAFSDVKSWIGGAVTDVGNWITARKKDIVGYYNKAKEAISRFATDLKNNEQIKAVIGTIKEGFGAVRDGITNAFVAVGDFAASIPDKISSVISGLAGLLGISNQVESALDAAENGDQLNQQEEEKKKGGHGGSF